MPTIYQGDEKIVDRYVGETLVTRTYQGDKLIFDAYSELSGTLPLAVRSRASQVLENYTIYGESIQDGTPTPDDPVEVTGLGVKTANLLDKNSSDNLYGHSISNSTGEIVVTNFFTATHKIDVTGGQSYVAEVFDSGTTAYIYIVEYNENDQFVKTTGLTTTGGTAYKAITLDATTTYVRMSLLTQLLRKLIFVPGSTAPSSYIPHGYQLPMKTSHKIALTSDDLLQGAWLVSSGNFSDLSSYVCTQKMPVESSTLDVYVKTSKITNELIVNFYSGNTYLGYQQFSRYTDYEAHSSFEVPTGATECAITVGWYGNVVIHPSDAEAFDINWIMSTPVYIGDSQLMRIPDTEYADYVDYEKGKIVRRVKKLVLTGDEEWSNSFGQSLFGVQRLLNDAPFIPGISAYSTHFKYNPVQSNLDPTMINGEFALQKSANVFNVFLKNTDFTSAADFKAWLAAQYAAGTPVTIWYVLETPIEEDPPVPFPDITLPRGTVTIDIEGNLKPQATVKGRINPVHYAYRINPDTAEITYLADNKNFTPAAMGSTTFDYGSWQNAFFMPRPCMLKSNGKVDYYLDPNDYSKKLDGTASDISDPNYDGNVMLEFPKIYYKFVPEGNDGEGGIFHCSNVKLDDDYECWCNYDANNNEIDHFYVAAYNGVILDGKMRSLSGYALTRENGAGSTRGADEIAAARANNQNGIDEWYTYLIADHQLLTYLATLMCKHVEHPTKFGRGIDSGSSSAKLGYVTGTLNDKGLFWGNTSLGNQAVKIFGIENFYACVWKRAAGLLGTSTGYAYKLTHGTKDGSTATSFGTTTTGYKTITRTKPATGYVMTMHHESNGFWIPATTSAETNNRYGDYYGNGNDYALVGGGSAQGAVCGSWAITLMVPFNGANWDRSTALSCKPKA